MLLEFCIANNHSVQPYEYLSTEPLDDGKTYLVRFTSSRRTETLRCPYCNGQVHICRKLRHAAAGYAEISENKADCRDELSSVSLPQLCTDIRREDSAAIPAHKNTRSDSKKILD